MSWGGHLHDGSGYPGHISRGILSSEDRPTTNTPYASKSHEQRTAERSLPLAAHIVCLICERRGDVGVRAGRDEEDAEIADAARGGETHDREADKSDEGIGDKNGAAHVKSVAVVGGENHKYRSQGILERGG